jgi:hypothetical protein
MIRTPNLLLLALAMAPLLGHGPARSATSPIEEEFEVKRRGPFEFAAKPVVKRDGDQFTIQFKPKAFCDVTVAVEDKNGRILRHLATGVLGKNAPAPFEKNRMEQALVWDGKDDQGEYVDDLRNVAIRVSLGLKPQFERHFLWNPSRRVANDGHAPTLNAPPPMVAQPEGVYVFDGNMFDHLRLFDHAGNYVRTVYPFPRDKINQLKGVETHKFPQTGKTLPLKGGNYQSTLLTSGTNRKGPYLQQLFGLAALGMAVQKGRVALVCRSLNRLATDGTTGGLPLEGPSTSIDGLLPRSAAFSPDAKTVYVTGFNTAGWRPNWRLIWAQGVAKIDFETGKKMETFAGALTRDRKAGGTEPGKFRSPVSVDTDAQGRVYVADRFNNRIQIFDPSGKHLKDIVVPNGDHSLPSEVCVNKRNGDVFVFSWYLGCHAFRKHGFHKRIEILFHFGPFDNPTLKAKYALPVANQSRRGRYGGDELQGREFRATIDPWANDTGLPNVWLIGPTRYARGADRTPPHRIFRMNAEKGKLELIKEFHNPGIWDGYGKAPLAVRPTTGELYVQNGSRPLVIRPETGKVRTVRMPMAPQSGGLYFDAQGHAYLRTSRQVARFAVSPDDSWREVPFDYGEAKGGRIASVTINTPSIHPQPAFSVSIHGHVVVGYIVGKIQYGGRADAKERAAREKRWANAKKWVPQMYRGRGGNSIVRVWNKNGKVLYDDAVPGIGYLHSVFMDRDHDIYMASEATRHGYFNRMSCSVAKWERGGKILSTHSPLPLPPRLRPDRPFDTNRGYGHAGSSWWEGAKWFYGGIGFGGKNNSTCHCPNFSSAHDYFARMFAPETGHYSVAVLDSAGNLILRIGRYGNVDQGVPLVQDGPALPNRAEIGGDEVSFFQPLYLATHTDHRVFVSDPGNQRIVSVKLGYHADERVPLNDAAGEGR